MKTNSEGYRFLQEEIAALNTAKETYLKNRTMNNRIEFKLQIMNIYSVINSVWCDRVISQEEADELRNEYYWGNLNGEFF
ncbi:hypothetical protein [Veillonella sp. VA137]|uniref:hypothetical protein n=1 Tax=Veillonella sp. VA137 TaxID=741828 RepID=UPI000F8DC08E|nr:hypothetical protein [Veillonella sp. VA137]